MTKDMGASADADRAGGPADLSPVPGLSPDGRSSTSAVETSAEISPCGRYRYWLGRKWDRGAMSLPIVMLNPSTADASLDDPTIRRCMAFARREGFGGIRVMNLFAFRATSPADMKAAADPVGPGNDLYLTDLFGISSQTGVPVLAAWGAHGDFMDRAAYVMADARFWGAGLVCLGTTAAGHPRHPLYVKGDQPFEPFPAQVDTRRMAETPLGGSVRSTGSAVGEADAPKGSVNRCADGEG